MTTTSMRCEMLTARSMRNANIEYPVIFLTASRLDLNGLVRSPNRRRIKTNSAAASAAVRAVRITIRVRIP